MKKAFSVLLIGLVTIACREEITPLKAPIDPSLHSGCQAPSIEKNIIGIWQFETVGLGPDAPIRRGRVTFDAQNNIIDPDSLYANYLDIGSSMAKVVTKNYYPDADYYPIPWYMGKIFRIDLVTKDGQYEKWPMYVSNNECKKIVIYTVSTYNLPNKWGFILTRQ